LGHSILEFADRHLIIRDHRLIEVLETLCTQLETTPNDGLSFLPEFLARDMAQINGCIDPEFEVHLNSEQKLSDFQRLIVQTQENVYGSEAIGSKANGQETQRKLDSLQKLQNLIYDSD